MAQTPETHPETALQQNPCQAVLRLEK